MHSTHWVCLKASAFHGFSDGVQMFQDRTSLLNSQNSNENSPLNSLSQLVENKHPPAQLRDLLGINMHINNGLRTKITTLRSVRRPAHLNGYVERAGPTPAWNCRICWLARARAFVLILYFALVCLPSQHKLQLQSTTTLEARLVNMERSS